MSIQEAVDSPSQEPLVDQAEALARLLFSGSMDLDKPILGMRDRDIVAANVHELLRDPNNTLAMLTDNDQVLGFSIAIPIGKMNPERVNESSETAYIYFTGIEPSHQGQGLVAPLMQKMVGKLKVRSYKFLERDAVLTQNWADNIERTYKGAIVEQYDHERWPEVGPERFFRIDLSKVD